MKKDKIRNASTTHKLARNLHQQFEQYTLREENSENQDLNYYNAEKGSDVKKGKNQVSNMSVKPVPKSYLLAMQSLQQSLTRKDEQVERLKNKLMEKENDMLFCETRINEALRKCKDLSQINEEKQIQNKILRSQIKQLQKDKQIALRQASNLLHGDIRQMNAQELLDTNMKMKRQRSKTMIQNQASMGSYPSINMSKPSEQLPKQYIELDQYSDGSFLRSPPESLNFISPLTSQRSKNRDYISYQRQILRNQKEMVALHYRVQCLQRKLSSETNKQQRQEIKLKLKKFQHDIETKQKFLIDLKKV